MQPVTKEQWQDAVDTASVLTLAVLFGMFTDDGRLNQERCFELLEDGNARGVVARIEAVSQFVASLQQACDTVEQADADSPAGLDAERLAASLEGARCGRD